MGGFWYGYMHEYDTTNSSSKIADHSDYSEKLILPDNGSRTLVLVKPRILDVLSNVST